MSEENEKRPEPIKRLDKLVAITVVLLSVFMAVTKVKDDNIVQAMHKAKSDAVDTWAEYQSARIKLHSVEHTLVMLKVLPPGGNADELAKAIADGQKDIERYTARSKETMDKARALEKAYDDMNVRDDQFDSSDVFLSIAIALAAVATLTEIWWLLYVSWASGGLGVALGVAAFSGLGFRMQWLADFLS